MARNIARILANKSHVFFTPTSADDFRRAQLGAILPTGKIRFMREMSMEFYSGKCAQDNLFQEIPNDRELWKMIQCKPGFDADEKASEKADAVKARGKAILARRRQKENEAK